MKKIKQYSVHSIFYSLQGEGYNTGVPVVFVRFAGCNLQCEFCDTNTNTFVKLTAEQIVAACDKFDCRFVVLTGGEPSLQADQNIIDVLHNNGYKIAIETNGTNTLPAGIDWVTCSPKENSKVVLTQVDELKIVYIGQDVEKWRTKIKAKQYMLQPCSQNNTHEVVDYILRHPHWRLSLQTHKYIYIA